MRRLALLVLLSAAACGGDDAPVDDDCDRLEDPVASPGDPIDGDTYATFASDFFETYCTRCHATTVTGTDRNGAPLGYNWDDEASVRDHLDEIRNAVGVSQLMPFNPPDPSCDERFRLVRWIDADAP